MWSKLGKNIGHCLNKINVTFFCHLWRTYIANFMFSLSFQLEYSVYTTVYCICAEKVIILTVQEQYMSNACPPVCGEVEQSSCWSRPGTNVILSTLSKCVICLVCKSALFSVCSAKGSYNVLHEVFFHFFQLRREDNTIAVYFGV